MSRRCKLSKWRCSGPPTRGTATGQLLVHGIEGVPSNSRRLKTPARAWSLTRVHLEAPETTSPCGRKERHVVYRCPFHWFISMHRTQLETRPVPAKWEATIGKQGCSWASSPRPGAGAFYAHESLPRTFIYAPTISKPPCHHATDGSDSSGGELEPCHAQEQIVTRVVHMALQIASLWT